MGTLQNFTTFKPGDHFVRGIPFKAHKINGFSPELFEFFYENTYGGAVRSLNSLEKNIAKISVNNKISPDHVALKQSELRLTNEIVLHEIFLRNLGEDGGEELANVALKNALSAGFGSFAEWQSEFTSFALAANSGWIALVWSNRFGRLSNICATDAASALAWGQPILVLNMNKSTYSLDFDSDRQSYVDAFMKSIHWNHVADDLIQASAFGHGINSSNKATEQISVKELNAMEEDNSEDFLVLDVRHDDDRERYRSRIMQTDFRNSFDVKSWADEIPRDKPVIVYCMYGFWVSQKVAEELREEGIDARSLSGGVTAWRAMGLSSSDNIY